MRRRCRTAAVTLAVLGLVLAARMPAQELPGAAGEVRSAEALRVFLDCVGQSCDYDFLRTEIDFVTHVAERHAAQVLVIVTAQPTAAGGTEFTASFLGRQEFEGRDDTLRYVAAAAAAPDLVRRGLAELLKRGLVVYVNHTPLAEGLRVVYGPLARPPSRNARDGWNRWVFGTSLYGSLSGETSFHFLSVEGSLSANRTTPEWKVDGSIQVGYQENTVEVDGGVDITTLSRDFSLDGLVVRSVGAHWSVGARGTLSASTFLNQSRALRLAPAVEYNLFPYSEATRRAFTVQYSVGATAFDYVEETIFGQRSERLLDQRVVASFTTVQGWGSAAASMEGSHYLRDPGKWSGTLASNVDLHLSRGFSLVLLGGFDLVRDQLYLPKRGATDEEILLRQRQLATSFRYWSSIGFAYRFGSPLADVVNPRFSGSIGGKHLVR